VSDFLSPAYATGDSLSFTAIRGLSKNFSSPKRPDWLWGAPSLLFNVWVVLCWGVKRPVREVYYSPYIDPRLIMSGAISLLPLYALIAWTGTTLPSVWVLKQLVRGEVYLATYNGFTLYVSALQVLRVSLVHWLIDVLSIFITYDQSTNRNKSLSAHQPVQLNCHLVKKGPD
jgi:hypothetical protein